MTQLSDLLNKLNHQEWSARTIQDRAAQNGHTLDFTTASRYLKGEHPKRPKATTLAAFAAAFSTDVNLLREAAGQPPVADRFELPPEADSLDPDERKAVVNLVRVMARGKAQNDDHHEDQPEPGTEAADEKHTSESSPEDGRTPGREGTPIGADELAQRRGTPPLPDRFVAKPGRSPLEEMDEAAREAGEEPQDTTGDA